MDFGFTKEEEVLIDDFREFLKENVTEELLEEIKRHGQAYGAPEGRKFGQKLGKRGWITPSWPREYGGIESSEMISYALRDEMCYALGAHLAFVGAHIAGPTIMKYGSEDLKKKFLLPIAKGEIEFALGYTEPDAGSDIMNLSIQAEDKGDHFLINGSKTFNTHCHVADYHWLAVRTRFDEKKKHKGITLIIVDFKKPGITINAMITMGGYRTNEVFYDNVKVSKDMVVGEVNNGAYYMLTALDYERMIPPSACKRLFEDMVAYSKQTIVDGRPLSENIIVRQKLAEMAVELEIVRLLYYRLSFMLDKGIVPDYQSSMQKLFASEMAQRISNACMEILGLPGLQNDNSKWAPVKGDVERCYRRSVVETIYAGTSEIQRNIIAQRGLRLARG